MKKKINKTKFDTYDYKFECMNCDDVFDDEKKAQKHTDWHKKMFKKMFKRNGKKLLAGVWKKL